MELAQQKGRPGPPAQIVRLGLCIGAHCIEMGASGSVMVAIVPTPLELPGSGGGYCNDGGEHEASSVLPLAYRHLSHFPVLAKAARGPVKPRPNERITHFLKKHQAAASTIAGFLCVKDRLRFLHTHKVGLPPKLLKPVFFGGPSRELGFLYCPAASGSPNGNPTGSGTTTTNGHSSCSGSGSGGTKSPGGSPALGPLGGNGGMDKGGLLQLEVRYRGSCLSRAVSLPVVTSALHRVIRSWLDKKLQGRDFDAILQMVQKLLAVFRPSEEVWYAIVNTQGEDGTTLLTYAVANARAPLPVLQQLMEVPCLDLGLPDRARGSNPIQLAYQLGRHDVLAYFASLVGSH